MRTPDPRLPTRSLLGIACAASAFSWVEPVYIELDLQAAFGWILALGGALCITSLQARSGRALWLAVCFTAILATADRGLVWLEASYQPLFAGYAWWNGLLLSWLGETAAAAGGRTHVFHSTGGFEILPSAGILAVRPLLLSWLAAALTATTTLRGSSLANLGRALPWILVTAALFAGRLLWSSVQYVSSDAPFHPGHHLALVTFWDPWTVLVAFVAAALVLGGAARRPRTVPPERARVQPLVCALLVGLSMGAAWSWVDPGRADRGRVLIDDRMSAHWEPSGRLLTTDRYGDFSAYSMAAMTEHLARRFSVEVNDARTYSDDYLAGFDVLVLKTPYQDFSAAERDAIARWTRAGGGLFVIGDHTDLGGMSTHLNSLVGPFGIRFRFDMTGPTEGGTFDRWSDPFPSEHPISHGMGDFSLMTGCSLALSGSARPVMTLRRAASRSGDYSRSSNFSELAPRPEELHGALVVAAATEVESGRVLAFADSTVLSSFAYYVESHADLVLRGIAWLNRSPSWLRWLPWLWAATGWIAAALLWRRGGIATGSVGLECAALLCVGLLLGVSSATAIAAACVRPPEPRGPAPSLGVVAEGGHAWLPPALGGQPDLPEAGNLTTFIQIPQRLGFETCIVPRDPDVLSGLDVLVLLNPDVEHGQEEAPAAWLEAVRAWVNEGGRLLVLQRRGHLDHDHIRGGLYLPAEGLAPRTSVCPELEISAATVGRGLVMRLVGSEFLDEEGLGHCMELPSRVQRQRYEACYDVFRALGGLTDEQRRTYLLAAARPGP